ncbi:PH and SEC7 domain-containing protein 4 [Sciurus carolinensis]|uniref:PH and SEC7 domain-containing protein 4 n=1 Tax=Sciurus carolinensis TaxID=30640 RepID=UPI001FB4CE60|nr:PH and SEC7 domain-containing protein 4 [Sciurus carolinensis]XP_047378572.1 PH and SEC7 domain-containing protein 4 [Sciurus carolinensis]
MGDSGLPDHPPPVGLLGLCLGDGLQPPGARQRETRGQPGPPEPCRGHAWASGSPESTGPAAPAGVSGVEPAHAGSCPRGSPRQNQSSSAQVVFWAGILQAQMCVLDLEEELEKAEGLRAGLRSCLPSSPPGLPGHGGLCPSQAAEEDSGEDSSGPEGENRAWPREGAADSSPEWGDEEQSVFFDNPLFLESPCSDAGASGECFSWGLPDSCVDARTRPDSPQTPEPLLPGGTGSWQLGREPDVGDSATATSGHATPPFPVPSYKPHPSCWASVPATQEGQASLEDQWGLASPATPAEDRVLSWETAHPGSDLSPATPPVQPWAPPTPEAWEAEEGLPWSPEPPISQDRGGRDARRPQEPAPCILAPGPWGSPESERRGLGPRPSPSSSPEGSPSPQRHSPGPFPKWSLDAPHSPLLESDGAEPSSLEREVVGEAPHPGQEAQCEGAARTPAAAGAEPGEDPASAEGPWLPLSLADLGSSSNPELWAPPMTGLHGHLAQDSCLLPESPMPQAHSPEEGQKTLAGSKLANGVGTADKAAWNLASRLFHLEGFRKSEVAAHLQKTDDFSRAVAEEYLSFFQFGGQSLDRALRGFLQALVLSGETQERERILYQFSRRFHHCNPGAFPSVDSVHTLTCAVMLLNTDLHGQNIGKSMSCQDFITNLNGLRDGGNFPKELLKALYWSIRSEKLEWALDAEDTDRPEKALPSPPGKMGSPFLQLAQDPTVPTYKQGILARKMHHDADGKKTPWGKRGWKMFHTLLRGMVLYFLKGEDRCLEGDSLVGHMVDEPVGVHHSLATPATHYTKKPHVFQLRTADWRLYLFQAPTAKEMTSWIARINLAAATHSAPPFPAAVGSQRRFVRPILPVGPAQSSLEEQHRSHENCLDAASDDLLDLQRNLPERRGRSRELEEYRLRKEYLEYEKTRYETYVQLLVARLRCPSGDLALWEERLGREAGGLREPKPSLKKSHSSPSLHQDEAPTTAKVKRNVSERRTYRKIIPKRTRNQL